MSHENQLMEKNYKIVQLENQLNPEINQSVISESYYQEVTDRFVGENNVDLQLPCSEGF